MTLSYIHHWYDVVLSTPLIWPCLPTPLIWPCLTYTTDMTLSYLHHWYDLVYQHHWYDHGHYGNNWTKSILWNSVTRLHEACERDCLANRAILADLAYIFSSGTLIVCWHPAHTRQHILVEGDMCWIWDQTVHDLMTYVFMALIRYVTLIRYHTTYV